MPDKFPRLYTLQKKDIGRAGEVLADAFRRDPVWNRLFAGEPGANLKKRAFFETPVRYCLHYGETRAISENLEGIACWVPGVLADMNFLRMVRSGAILSGMKIGLAVAKKLDRCFRQITTDRRETMNGRPFVYLAIIGVASRYQGKGYGGTLLRGLFEQCDTDFLPVYLETETEENVKMYEGFGFRTIRKIMVPDIDLPMWEMVRE